MDEEETKSLLDSNHEDAVLKTPPESVKSKSPDATAAAIADATPAKKVVLKRKLALITISGPAETTADVTAATSDAATTAAADAQTTAESTATAADSAEKKRVKLSEVSAKERLEMRAKKFGTPIAPESAKLARSERFGLTNASTTPTGGGGNKITTIPVSVEILKKRAERFGGSVSSEMNKIDNLEKLQKRQARFGNVDTKTTVKVQVGGGDVAATITTTAAPSKDEFAEKARLRLERFKTATPAV